MALVTLKNLGKRAGGKWALWDVNLEIDSGEIVGVFGTSGSGKSTLGRILAGLDEPTNGSVIYGDAEAEDSEEKPFQASLGLNSPALAPELTVHENLEMFALLWGIPRRKRGKEIAFLLEMLELDEVRAKRTGCISSGAAKRVELARALLADSPLLIIDGLLESLDSHIFEKVWEHLLSLRRNRVKSAVVLTSSGRIAETCQKLAVIHRGRIGFMGRSDDFRRMAGEDMVVLGETASPAIKSRIQEQFSVVIREENGFLSFRVGNGERVVSDILSEFGSEVGCVYLKRPTLEDALAVLSGSTGVAAGSPEGRPQ